MHYGIAWAKAKDKSTGY